MSEKRYQIFVSSTYTDLMEERQKIFSTIMMLNHIPAGMEFFGAVDEDQMKFIQRVIDESDYYVLLLGARYGSQDENGMSFTEREYDYAVSKGLKVIALVHEKPDDIERGKTDKNEEMFQKFMSFRGKVTRAKRVVCFWRNREDLVTNFTASLMKTIQLYPATGWMRGDNLASKETLRKVAELELENQRLRENLQNATSQNIVTKIQVEAVSTSYPFVYSDREIECVSVNLSIKDSPVSMDDVHPGDFPHWDQETFDTSLPFYFDQAIPWLEKILRVCQFKTRITNPHLCMVENLVIDQCLFSDNGTAMTLFDAHFLGEPPTVPRLDWNVANRIDPPRSISSLNPKQTVELAGDKMFIPQSNLIAKYQLVISAKNILEPIHKELFIRCRIVPLEMRINEVVNFVDGLYEKKRFNNEGVFAYVAALLKQEKKAESVRS